MSAATAERGGCSKFACCYRNFLIVAVFLLIIAGNELVEGAVRNVNLIIEPPAVRRGQHAVIRCLYNLDGEPLYSAKFYRGQWEFYRYTPGEFPHTKVFPFPGIHVDVTNSNATQVLIRNVGFGISGNFSCEVTADINPFSTAIAFGTMQVVELPEKRPLLVTKHGRYEPGENLLANCSTPPSRPRADLKFTINNMVVSNTETQYLPTIDNLIVTRISLNLTLQGIHFSSAHPSLVYGQNGYGGQMLNSIHGRDGGSLVLRCTAQIGDLYQEYKEIELGTPLKDPVPARVTHNSGISMTSLFSSYFSSSARSTAAPSLLKLILLSVSVLVATATTTTIALASTTATALISTVSVLTSAATAVCIELFTLPNQILRYKNREVNKVANTRSRQRRHCPRSRPVLRPCPQQLQMHSTEAHAKRLLSQR